MKEYCIVASSRMFWLVAHPRIFTLVMKGKFDPSVLMYRLYPLAKKVQN